ncbi:MAG: hypothetical protein R3C59_28060 [Planctomycetaceae bacterium]
MSRILLLMAVVASLPHIAFADEQPAPLTVASALAQRIIDPALPLSEVQAYTESRILPVPQFTTVAEWETYANQVRQDVLDKVVFRGEAATWRHMPTQVEWQDDVKGGRGYHIRRFRYEVVPGMWTAGLLYEPTQLTGKVPVIMNVNGHDRADGKAADYKQMRCINQAKRGMIAMNLEWLGMGQLATPGFGHYNMNQMNLCGTSGLAPFYLAMSRGLDILLQHEHADPTRVGVAGLSGGGWQTIFISSLDTRVTLCNPVAGYSSFRTRARYTSDLGDSEQTPCDLASVTDYAQLTALLAPRPTLLTNNVADQCCFKAEHALPPLLEAAGPIYRLYDRPQNLRYHVNHDPGSHNFLQDNRQQLYRLLGDFFFADQGDYDSSEIASDDEIRTKQELNVELPENNLDFNTLALKLCDQRQRSLPADESALANWQNERRPVLQEIVRWKNFELLAIQQGQQNSADVSADWWWLRLNGDWTVPAVRLSLPDQPASKQLTILIADGGRATLTDHASRLLKSGHDVLAVDPFYFGESKIAERDFLYAILVASLGDRPLGIQAGQVAAAARWAASEFGYSNINVVASGPRTSLMALIAAGLCDDIDSVELHGCLGSLRELLEQNMGMDKVPESLCFGLLKEFDIPELVALAGPASVRFATASPRCQTELQTLISRLPKATQQLLVNP